MENFANVAARWRNPPWDPRRRYSVPWAWGGIGMVVDGAVYDGDIGTSAIVFDPPPELEGKINVAPAMGDIIAMALLYVGAKPCTGDEAALSRAREVLAAARPKWRSMDYGIADSMARGEIAAAATWSSAALRARMAKPSIRFGYPREGYPLWMDSVVVLKDAANASNAKLFQDFVMAPENAALISAFAGHANGIDGSEAFLPDDMKGAGEIVVPAEAAKAGVFLPVCPEPVNALYTAIWAELVN
jgi:spermidine/putrescine transport system substrate-binding protein